MSQFNIFSEVDQRVETDARPSLPSIDSMGSLPALLRSYEKILGWSFRFVPSVSKAEGMSVADEQSRQELNNRIPVEIRFSGEKTHEFGFVEYRCNGAAWSSFEALARQAASAIADMIGESVSTRYQLWRRESELASKSALLNCQHNDADRSLAFVLQNILRDASDALGCVAAAMYLLDDKTSELKMRSCWGLPTERLLDPARSLRSSAADLEAMLGRDVVMENENSIRQWRAPEDFQSGLCIPIVSQSNVLGTVWFYSRAARRFSSRQIQMAKLIAGRLATELERDALFGVYLDRESIKKEIEAAALIQKNQAPIAAPWIEKWDMAGKVRQNRDFGGNFYDWFTSPSGQIVCALADCQDQGTTAALTAAMVKSSLRSHAQYQSEASDLTAQVDRTVWASSAADQYVNLFCATLDSKTNRVNFTTAGKIQVYLVDESNVTRLSQETAMLGQAPETEFASSSVELEPRAALIAFSSQPVCPESETTAILNRVQSDLSLPARRCARDVFDSLKIQNAIPTDFSLLTIKRK